MNHVTPPLVAACLALAAANFSPSFAPAQPMNLTPRIIAVDKVKCAELLARTGADADRLLLYYNGYVDGMRRQTTWDERAAGELVERALRSCKADPAETILSAFTRAAR